MVLSQICIFVCGFKFVFAFLRIDFRLKFTGNFVFKFEFLKRAEFIYLLDLDFGKFASRFTSEKRCRTSCEWDYAQLELSHQICTCLDKFYIVKF